MDRDTPNKLDQFSGNLSGLHSPTSNYQQPTSSLSSQQQQQPLASGGNYGNQPNQWTNQMMNQYNNQWNNQAGQYPLNNNVHQQNQHGGRGFSGLSLSPEDQKILKDCSSRGFWTLSLPAVFGYSSYRQYLSVKNLKPYTFSTMIWQSCLVFLATKFLWFPKCISELTSNNPNLMNRLKEMNRANQMNTQNQSYYPNQQPYSNQYPAQGQQQYPPVYRPSNSPYLNPTFQPPSQQNKEFVDESYDVGGYDKDHK